MAGIEKQSTVSEDYLETLEKVKKQYVQYVEVSKLYDLPTEKHQEPNQNLPASPENPLTTNSFRIK